MDNTFKSLSRRDGPKQVVLQILKLLFSVKFLSNNRAIAATYSTASRSGSVKRAQILTPWIHFLGFVQTLYVRISHYYVLDADHISLTILFLS